MPGGRVPAAVDRIDVGRAGVCGVGVRQRPPMQRGRHRRPGCLEQGGQHVESRRPELARWVGTLSTVRSVNHNGRALIQFDGADDSWHDIAPEFLTVEAAT